MSFILRSLMRALPRTTSAGAASSLVGGCLSSWQNSALSGASSSSGVVAAGSGFVGGVVCGGGRAPARFGSRKAGSVGTKTKSAVKKRFRVRGGGTLVRQAAGKRHLNIHKTRRHVNRLSE